MAETCSACGHLTQEGKDAMRERAKKHPIYKTNFDRPLSETIKALRGQIVQIRGQLSDIRFAYPGWGERTQDVEGLLTCGLVVLHNLMEEMSKSETLNAE